MLQALCHLHFRSLGTFLYLMISGVSPFYDENSDVMVNNIKTKAIDYSEELFPHISEGCLTLLKVMFIRTPR